MIKQAAERDASLTKTAALELEVSVLRDVLDLVSAGLLDPDDATTKLAGFMLDPAQLTLIKQASAAGFVVSADLGRLGDTDPDVVFTADADPLDKLAGRLRTILDQ